MRNNAGRKTISEYFKKMYEIVTMSLDTTVDIDTMSYTRSGSNQPATTINPLKRNETMNAKQKQLTAARVDYLMDHGVQDAAYCLTSNMIRIVRCDLGVDYIANTKQAVLDYLGY